MSKIKIINDFCNDAIEKRKVLPLSFSFPSFEITEESFKNHFYELMENKFHLGLLTNKYNTVKYFENNNIGTLEIKEAELAVKQKNSTPLQNAIVTFMNKIVPNLISADTDFNLKNANLETTHNTIVSCAKDKFSELAHQAVFVEFDGNKSSFDVEKSKFVATFIILEKQFPKIYDEVISALKIHSSVDFLKILLEDQKTPDIGVINEIFKYDSKLSEELFPKETMSFRNAKKKINF